MARPDPAARETEDALLLAEIEAAHQELEGNPGVRRTWAHLNCGRVAGRA